MLAFRIVNCKAELTFQRVLQSYFCPPPQARQWRQSLAFYSWKRDYVRVWHESRGRPVTVNLYIFATLLDMKNLYIKRMAKQNLNQPDISGVHIWLMLWKVTRVLEGHSNRSVEVFSMGRSDFGVLEALLHKGPLPVNALGAKVLLTSGSITTAIDRLERRGLVERSGDPSDRRARIVHLTGAGRKLIHKLFTEHEQAMEKAAFSLAPEERVLLLELLRKLGRGAEEIADDSSSGKSRRRRTTKN